MMFRSAECDVVALFVNTGKDTPGIFAYG